MLLIGGFQMIGFIGNNTFLDQWFDVDELNEEISVSSNVNNTLPQNTGAGYGTGGIGTGIFTFFNVIALIMNFIVLIMNMLLMPLIIFMSISGMPFILQLMIGMPLTIVYITGLIWFIRGSGD